MSDIQVGDWVRFYSCGALVIGVVEYVRPRESWERADRIATTAGSINADAVLEVRRRTR